MTNPSTDRVVSFIQRHSLDAEIIPTPDGVPTVETAAQALGVETNQIIKTLVFLGPEDELVIAIACGTGRVDRKRLAAAVDLPKLSMASSEIVLESTGYPAGGVAPVDLPDRAHIVVDTRVIDQDWVFGGSGTDLHMIRIRSADIVALNRAQIASILVDPAK